MAALNTVAFPFEADGEVAVERGAKAAKEFYGAENPET
jgi:hypothetical protein